MSGVVVLGEGWIVRTKTKDRTPGGTRRLLVTSLERAGGRTSQSERTKR